VGSLDHVDLRADVVVQAGGVADDDLDLAAPGEQVPDEPAADLPGRGGHDDHEGS